MIWQNGELKNPITGKSLARDSSHSFSDGEERFPLIDEIPFLRFGRDELKTEALRALDLKDARAALTFLLQDQDDWARSAPPEAKDLQPLFENKEMNLREAMQRLKYGAVADYFAYRWSDPTFLSGLALLEWHLPESATNVFELCCGIGHYLREMILRGIAATGADVVFSKLWLARKFVAPAARLVCFDANSDFPFREKTFDAAFCHDAFYFLPEKQRVARELKRTTEGAILIGHAHNREVDNYSSGAAVSVAEYAEIVRTACGSGRVFNITNPPATAGGSDLLYDDEELTRSTIENRQPVSKTIENLKSAAAIAIVETTHNIERSQKHFDVPAQRQKLRINPLLFDERESAVCDTPLFPSERYENEYSALSNYLNLTNETISNADLRRAANGDWANDKKLLNLARRRILLDLPEKW